MSFLYSPYSTGTVSISNGSDDLVGVGTAWASLPIVPGDLFAAQGLIVPIATVTDDENIILEYDWPGTTISGGSYLILKNSPERYDPAITQAKARDFLARLDDMTPIYMVAEGEEPDPGIGNDGDVAMRFEPGEWTSWVKETGAWVEQDEVFSGVSSTAAFTADNRLIKTDRPTSDNKVIQQTGITVDDSNNVTSPGSLAGAALIPSGSSVPTNGIYLPATNTIGFATAGSEVLRILSNNAIVKGHTAQISTFGSTPIVQQFGTVQASATMMLAHWANSGAGPALMLTKSRGAAIGTNTIVQENDTLGQVIFCGDDGTDVETAGARIRAIVGGTPGANDLPTRLDFQTCPDGSATMATCAQIWPDAGVTIGSPTGSTKGAGTLNATAVYDDNSLLTCMALAKEFREKGEIDLDKWDGLTPDLEVPAEIEPERRETVPVVEKVRERTIDLMRQRDGSFEAVEKEIEVERPLQSLTPVYDRNGNGIDAIVEPVTEEIVIPENVVREAQTVKRIHGTARVFKAMIESGFDPRDPEQYFTKMQGEEALPGMPTKVDWVHGALSMGEMASRQWLAVEMLAIVTNAMWIKLRGHETRIAALEGSTPQPP